ncbi:MAG: type II secretion system protein [Verrucomicrobiales bacterium]
MKISTHRPLRQRVARRAFTLVELLVVIAIIAVLVALAFVGARKGLDAATLAKGMSRIKSLQQANAAYAADNNGKFAIVLSSRNSGGQFQRTDYNDAWCNNPGFVSHLTGHDKPINSESRMDERVLDPVEMKAKGTRYWYLGVSYGAVHTKNVPGPGWQAGGGNIPPGVGEHNQWSVHTVHDPSRMAAFITSNDHLGKFSGRYIWRDNPGFGYSNGRVSYRYPGEKALAVFFDGHVETFTMADMERIDASGGSEDNVFWGGTVYEN